VREYQVVNFYNMALQLCGMILPADFAVIQTATIMVPDLPVQKETGVERGGGGGGGGGGVRRLPPLKAPRIAGIGGLRDRGPGYPGPKTSANEGDVSMETGPAPSVSGTSGMETGPAPSFNRTGLSIKQLLPPSTFTSEYNNTNTNTTAGLATLNQQLKRTIGAKYDVIEPPENRDVQTASNNVLQAATQYYNSYTSGGSVDPTTIDDIVQNAKAFLVAIRALLIHSMNALILHALTESERNKDWMRDDQVNVRNAQRHADAMEAEEITLHELREHPLIADTRRANQAVMVEAAESIREVRKRDVQSMVLQLKKTFMGHAEERYTEVAEMILLRGGNKEDRVGSIAPQMWPQSAACHLLREGSESRDDVDMCMLLMIASIFMETAQEKGAYGQSTITAVAFALEKFDLKLRLTQSHIDAKGAREKRSKTINNIRVEVKNGTFSSEESTDPTVSVKTRPATEYIAEDVLWQFLALTAMAATCKQINQLRFDSMSAEFSARQDVPGGDLDTLAAVGAGEFAPTARGLKSLKDVLRQRAKVPHLEQGSLVVCDRESREYKVANAGNNSNMLEEDISQERLTHGTPRMDTLCNDATRELQDAMVRLDIFIRSAGRRPAKMEDWVTELIQTLKERAGSFMNGAINCPAEILFAPFIGPESAVPCLFATIESLHAVGAENGTMVPLLEKPSKNPSPGIILAFETKRTTDRAPRNCILPDGISKPMPIQPYDRIRKFSKVCVNLTYRNDYPGGDGPPGVKGTAIPGSGYGPRSIKNAMDASAGGKRRRDLRYLRSDTAAMMILGDPPAGATVRYANPKAGMPEAGNLSNGSIPTRELYETSIFATGCECGAAMFFEGDPLSAIYVAGMQIGQFDALMSQ
jgi:hypothetical protein